MATKKKRINISLSKKLYVFLQDIALRDEMPTATKAAELLKQAVEEEQEDEYRSRFAEERDTPDAEFVSHEEAWKK